MNIFLTPSARPMPNWETLAPEELLSRLMRIMRIQQVALGLFMPSMFAAMVLAGFIKPKGSAVAPAVQLVLMVVWGFMGAVSLFLAIKFNRDARAALAQVDSRQQRISILIRCNTLVTALCCPVAVVGVLLAAQGVPHLGSLALIAVTPIAMYLMVPGRDEVAGHLLR